MARLSKHADKVTASVREHSSTAVTNFMGGTSYTMTPLHTLKMIAASSIFGEPQYYKDGINSPKSIKNVSRLIEFSLLKRLFTSESGKPIGTAADVFTKAVDNALDFDFKGTLDLALELRTDYFMRLNPSVIFVRASIHKDREKFNEENPGVMKSIGKAIVFRPDDITNQFEYFMFINGSKKGLSSFLKRTWAEKLSEFSRYQLNKYKGKRLIDLVRISHANSKDINELMKTGTIEVKETEQTWETMRSAKHTWRSILETIDVPHMALLRNLKGIFTEINDITAATEILDSLKAGVVNGKQFPFRYQSAYKVIQTETLNHKAMVLDALEECMDIAVANMPKIEGKVMCLSDNSGSAWGAITSEYGTTKIAEIANLSSLITAKQADEGYVGQFGDKLFVEPVSKRNVLLKQAEALNKKGHSVGGGTENGIWLFWDKAIRMKDHWDTVFIYSDQQAGTGGLYGTNPSDYKDYVYKSTSKNIDVLSLVEKYRQTVNPKVNVFSVQVAGYDNTILPENLYRGALLTGWTGKESTFAHTIINTWDEIENKTSTKKIKKSVTVKKTRTSKTTLNKA